MMFRMYLKLFCIKHILLFQFALEILAIKRSIPSRLGVPDYTSPWTSLVAQDPVNSYVRLPHGLGEAPMLVEVQVKVTSGPNAGFYFPGIGGAPREDDFPEDYGGVVYLYDATEVLVMAPLNRNGFEAGAAVYTENDTYFAGPNSQLADSVKIRVKAWKSSSLPPADFSVTGITIEAQISSPESVRYIEQSHGLGNYPGLVIVRVRLNDTENIVDNYYSDGSGSSMIADHRIPYQPDAGRLHVYGYNNDTVRVWTSTGGLSSLRDGYMNLATEMVRSGKLEIHAWRMETLLPTMVKMSMLGPAMDNEDFHIATPGCGTDIYARVMAEAQSGPNAGYRFPGSGAQAFVSAIYDDVCSYGGLTYAYNTEAIRMWRPSATGHGGLICVNSDFGNGTNSQRSSTANIVAMVWATLQYYDDSSFEVENTCRRG